MPASSLLVSVAKRLGLRKRSTKVVPFDGDIADGLPPREEAMPASSTTSQSLAECASDGEFAHLLLPGEGEKPASEAIFADAADLASALAEAMEFMGEIEAEAKEGTVATADERAHPHDEEAEESAQGLAAPAADEDTKSVDSLTFSQLSEDEGPELIDLVRPPRIPGPLRIHPESNKSTLDGHWVLCSPKGDTANWLDSLTIQGMQVVDGEGGACRLRKGNRGPKLFGGRLKATRGDVLFRIGRQD